MSVAIVTGSAGLIGAEAVRFFSGKGFDVVGIDNNMRRAFFGDDASTEWSRRELEATVPSYSHHDIDIRDAAGIEAVFARYGKDIRPGDPHGGTTFPRLGGEGPANGLLRQRQRHPGPAGSHAQTLPRCGLHLHLDKQGLRRQSEPPALAWNSSRAGKWRPAIPMRRTASTNRCRSTRPSIRCSASRSSPPT